MDHHQKDVRLLKSKLKRLLEHNPLYANRDSMKTQTLWGLPGGERTTQPHQPFA